MKSFIFSILLAGGLTAFSAGAATEVRYGFAPTDATEAELNALGTGNNSFLESAIRVDAATDPLVGALKGNKITGVRCFLRSDYKQKSKGFSCIRLYPDGLESTPVVKNVNFTAGWNEIYFDEPVEIGSAPVYVGFQVYETQGDPYPMASYKNAGVPGLCLIRAAKGAWEDYGSRGALAIEAIVEADPALTEGYALASPFNVPLAVMPGKEFECSLYVHNQSATPVTSLTYEGFDSAGQPVGTATVTFAQPIAAYGSATVPVRIMAPDAEGAEVPLTLRTTAINGAPAKECMSSTIKLYISSDVFNRIPLVEEFTGLSCTNCPFMFYYLDLALEQFGAPHVYVAHHAGFQNDILTQPCDEELLYLFGSPNTFNPAAMYDRRVPVGANNPIQAANDPSPDPYMARLSHAMEHPALAKVLVDSEITAQKAGCTVHGKIGKAAMAYKDDLYVTVYLLENDIPNSALPQLGLNPPPEGAPDDLLERFRHTGVIRHDFCGGSNGVKLQVAADGSYSVDFSTDNVSQYWNLDNCDIVAFVHKVNKEDMTDNYVLNAGAERYNDFADGNTLVKYVDTANLRIYEYGGRIMCSDAAAHLEVYSISGMRCDSAARQVPGMYVVRATMPGGVTATARVLVR